MALKVPVRFRGDRSKTGLEAERVFDILGLYVTQERVQSGLKLVIARALDSFDIETLDWLILKEITKSDEEGVSVSQLAIAFDMNTPQMTIKLKELTKQNLIKPKTSPKDRRMKNIKCSRRGSRIMFEAEQEIQHAMRYWLFDLTDSEIENYQALIDKIVAFDIPQNYS